VQARARRGGGLGTDLAGVDLLPADGGWTVLEANGAVDFSSSYALEGDVFSTVREALVLRDGIPPVARVLPVVEEAAAGLAAEATRLDVLP
jgi:hypothetical protein